MKNTKQLGYVLRQAATAKSGRQLVFAYGSNMNAEQMGRRCPRAVYMGPAGISRMRLGFTGFSDRWQGSVATLEPHSQSFAVGRLWRVDGADLKRLDAFEGAPGIYQRVTVRVLCEDGTHEEEAQTYIHRDTAHGPWVMPSAEYLQIIRHGYETAGFDKKLLSQAVCRCRQLVVARDEYDEEEDGN